MHEEREVSPEGIALDCVPGGSFQSQLKARSVGACASVTGAARGRRGCPMGRRIVFAHGSLGRTAVTRTVEARCPAGSLGALSTENVGWTGVNIRSGVT
jgi:hypothetical protein